MTPSARIKAILDLFAIFEKSPVPMDVTIGDYMRGRRYIGSKDRRFIVEHVYGIVRAKARLDWWLQRVSFGDPDNHRHRLLTWLFLGRGHDLPYISSLFDDSRYGASALSGNEGQLLEQLQAEAKDGLMHDEMPLAARVECPAEYEDRLKAVYGDDFEHELGAMIDGATLDMRVNLNGADKAQVIASLEKDGVQVEQTPYSPWGLRALDKAYLSKTKAFNKGHVAIQDEGSQMISAACGVKPGMQVLDYCAGGGGKTLALAACMKNKGRLVAMDVDERRLERAKPRFKKAHILDIVEVRPLSEERHRKWLCRQKGTFDIVLTDVPCSGSGTWRRNPDTKWINFGPELDALVQVQGEILDKVAKTVKPGGRLIYATCSLFREENEAQVEAFLERHDSFELVPFSAAWTYGDVPDHGEPYMRLSPYKHKTDGFFAAILQKK